MPDVLSQEEVDRLLSAVDTGSPYFKAPSHKYPVAIRLRAQIDDCKKQIGKLNTKRDMLLRQIETLEDAVRELEAKGTQ